MNIKDLFQNYDGILAARLNIIDSNIEMMTQLKASKKVDALKDAREKLIAFYAGEGSKSDVPYYIWELTSGIPAWGTYGT